MTKNIIPIVIVALSLSGCSTLTESTLLGAGSFGAIGAGIGTASGNNFSSAAFGLGIGALVGSGFGYLAFKAKEEKEKEKLIKPVKDKDADKKAPSLSEPEVRRIWIDEKTEGNRLEEGHWIWVIEKPSHWTR